MMKPTKLSPCPHAVNKKNPRHEFILEVLRPGPDFWYYYWTPFESSKNFSSETLRLRCKNCNAIIDTPTGFQGSSVTGF